MKRLIDNALTVIIAIIMLIAMIAVMCGCDNLGNSFDTFSNCRKGPCNKENYSVLIFTADWCTSCKNDNDRIKQLKTIADVRIINVDDNPTMVRLYNVKSIPFYVVSQRGSTELFRTNDIETVFVCILGCM